MVKLRIVIRHWLNVAAAVALPNVQGETMRRLRSSIRQLALGVLFGVMLLCLTQASVSSGVPAAAKEQIAARELQKFLTAPAAAPIIKKHGLERATRVPSAS